MVDTYEEGSRTQEKTITYSGRWKSLEGKSGPRPPDLYGTSNRGGVGISSQQSILCLERQFELKVYFFN